MSKIGIAEEILKRVDGHLSSNPGFRALRFLNGTFYFFN
jgi:hypothetical protein